MVDTRSRRFPSASWQFRELFRQLVIRNLKVRYQRSGLGFLWLLVNPALTAAILVLVFGYIVRLDVEHYWAFLISGYFAWVFVLHTLTTSVSVIPEHSHMARSVAVPADVFVLAAVTSRLIEFVVEIALVAAALALFHHGGVPLSYLLLPVLTALLLLLTLGLALPAAALSVFYRDLQHVLPAALMMLMYLSPVFYPAELVPAPLSQLYFVNPVAAVITLFHEVLYVGRLPSLAHLGGAAAASAAVYVIGHAIFRRERSLFAEIV
jgi:ABC-type polysaccharide/polyol phosphate export permease